MVVLDIPVLQLLQSLHLTGGSGNYIFNEVVTGAASSATGRVKSWDASTMELNVSIATGAFTVGEVITGSTSGATYEYQIVAEYKY